jgi:hypothetical protein
MEISVARVLVFLVGNDFVDLSNVLARLWVHGTVLVTLFFSVLPGKKRIVARSYTPIWEGEGKGNTPTTI